MVSKEAGCVVGWQANVSYRMVQLMYPDISDIQFTAVPHPAPDITTHPHSTTTTTITTTTTTPPSPSPMSPATCFTNTDMKASFPLKSNYCLPSILVILWWPQFKLFLDFLLLPTPVLCVQLGTPNWDVPCCKLKRYSYF